MRSRYYRSKYSLNTESVFVKIETDSGVTGWGEAQAPLVPEATAHIIHNLVGPFLLGRNPFEVRCSTERRVRRYARTRYTGGFTLDAITACDIALWDIIGCSLERPVYERSRGRLPNPTRLLRIGYSCTYPERTR